MLMGQGQWLNNQTAYPPQVYWQINTMAVKAWKPLPNKGEVSGNLTKIIQGSTEPFSDFVDRMMEAAGRIFGDPDTTMPLITVPAGVVRPWEKHIGDHTPLGILIIVKNGDKAWTNIEATSSFVSPLPPPWGGAIPLKLPFVRQEKI